MTRFNKKSALPLSYIHALLCKTKQYCVYVESNHDLPVKRRKNLLFESSHLGNAVYELRIPFFAKGCCMNPGFIKSGKVFSLRVSIQDSIKN